VTQINYIGGGTCTTADCGVGGTLGQFDQTLQSYSVLPSGNSWAWDFVTNLFSWQDFGAAQIDAQNKGYYKCLGNEMIPFKGLIAAAAAKGAEELATNAAGSYGSSLAGAYYHFTDGRFTAWGASSRVLVPNAAAKIAQAAKVVSAVGWLATDIEGAHAIYKCSGTLTGKSD